MLNEDSRHDKIVRAAMTLARSRGWRDVTLADIADEAEVSLSALYGHFRSKTAILEAFIEAVDAEMLKQSKKPDMNAPARDRVFEVVMTRLDVLKPYREALRRIRGEARRGGAGSGTPRLLCASASSRKWMLAAAGVPADGGRGCVRVTGLMCVYGKVMPVWFRDEDPDLAKTMAVLDRELRNGERWLKRFDAVAGDLRRLACCFVPRRRGQGSPGAAPEPPPPPPAPEPGPEPGPGPAPMAEQPGGA